MRAAPTPRGPYPPPLTTSSTAWAVPSAQIRREGRGLCLWVPGPSVWVAEQGGAVLGESGTGCQRPRALCGDSRVGLVLCGPCLRLPGVRTWAVPHVPPTSWHRGTFYQGYLCTKCGVGAHKECLEVTPPCKISEYRRPRDAPRGPVLGLQ